MSSTRDLRQSVEVLPLDPQSLCGQLDPSQGMSHLDGQIGVWAEGDGLLQAYARAIGAGLDLLSAASRDGVKG